MQFQTVREFSLSFIEQARQKLQRRLDDPNTLTLDLLKGQGVGRLVCPFCLYSSKKSKFSAAIFRINESNLFFKCFCCNKKGVVE